MGGPARCSGNGIHCVSRAAWGTRHLLALAAASRQGPAHPGQDRDRRRRASLLPPTWIVTEKQCRTAGTTRGCPFSCSREIWWERSDPEKPRPHSPCPALHKRRQVQNNGSSAPLYAQTRPTGQGRSSRSSAPAHLHHCKDLQGAGSPPFQDVPHVPAPLAHRRRQAAGAQDLAAAAAVAERRRRGGGEGEGCPHQANEFLVCPPDLRGKESRKEFSAATLTMHSAHAMVNTGPAWRRALITPC